MKKNENKIFKLIIALQDKETTDLNRSDRRIIKEYYDSYFISRAKANHQYLSGIDIYDELIKCGLNDLAKSYKEQSLETDYKVFEYAVKNLDKNKLTFMERKDINIFKALLYHKNKTVTLTELYKFIYRDLLSRDELKKNIVTDKSGKEKFSDIEIGLQLLDDINGCFSESLVSEIDFSLFDSDKCNIKDIKIERGSNNNPLLFITALKNAPIVNLIDTDDMKEEDEISFLVISDLHLGTLNCHNYDGSLDLEKLEGEIQGFDHVKNKLFKSLRKQNIKLTGLVFTGDILDAGGGRDERAPRAIKYVSTRRNDYANKIIELCHNNNYLSIPSAQDRGPEVILYIPGNHDVRIGRKKLDEIVKLFRDDIISLENGSARFKVGNSRVALIHSSTRDWGVNVKFPNRVSEVRASFRIEEYFKICQSVYNGLGSDKSKYTIESLLKLVDKKIKEENPRLYNYFRPYITSRRNDENHYETFFSVGKKILFNPQTGELKLACQSNLGGLIGSFNDFLSNVNGCNIVRRLKTNISQYVIRCRYAPDLTILGHFHRSNKSRNKYWNIANNSDTIIYSEGCSKTTKDGNYMMESSLYTLKFSKGKLSRVVIKPYTVNITRKSINGQISFHSKVSNTPELVYVKKK